MTPVYYNDSEPFVCAWLKNLIDAKLLPAGDVDERPIQEVSPDDVRRYTQAHFFAGIGGWPYALQLAGWGDRAVWTGSCPCPSFSLAGRGRGLADDRHLWPEWFRLIRERHPDRLFGEQVPGAVGLDWLDIVATDMEAAGYAVGAIVLGAHSVGAPHIRQRLWFVADSSLDGRFAWGRGRRSENLADAADFRLQGVWATREQVAAAHGAPEVPLRDGRDTGFWATEPAVGRVAHGIPARVGRLRAYGNAIVPQVAAAFVSAYLECAP